jgi:hypothetical protein
MIEIRFHGRGGQGAVSSAELLALAAIEEGKFAQAFPSFGPERRGAPVLAFCRISSEPIRIRANIYEPDLVVVLDASLLKIVNVAAGLKPDGILVTTRTSHYEYHHAWVFGQGFGIGQEGVFYLSFEGAVWSNCRKEHFCFRKGLSGNHPHPITFCKKR